MNLIHTVLFSLFTIVIASLNINAIQAFTLHLVQYKKH